MKRKTERLHRMMNRFQYHGFNNVKVLHPPEFDSDEFKKFIKGIHLGGRDALINCTYAHIKALRTFLETDYDECLIMEDDVMLHNNFNDKLSDILSTRQSYAKCILLSPYFSVALTNNRKLTKDLYVMANGTFSAACYYVTREFAKYANDIFDRPLSEYPFSWIPNLVSEDILCRMAGSVCAFPPLAIEECVDSDLNAVWLEGKRKYWEWYGIDNYADAEKNNKSSAIESISNLKMVNIFELK